MLEPRRPPRWRRILGGLLYTGFLASVFLMGTAAGWIRQSPTMSAIIGQVLHPQPPQEVFHDPDGTTLLLLGCDEERYYQNIGPDGKPRGAPTLAGGSPIRRKYARADMILVARMDFKNRRITALSIPRDTEVKLPGYRRQKINAFHKVVWPTRARGPQDVSEQEGPAMMQRAVEEALPGVHIDRVLRLDYESFEDMVNLIGGVPVKVDRDMDYDDYAGNVHIHLKTGPHQLDGYDSMMFVRYRHGDSDFKRQDRQKEFLLAFKNAAMRDKFKLPQLVEKARAAIGNTLTSSEIASLAFFAQGLPPNSIQMGQVPVVEASGTRLRIDEDKLDETLNKFNMIPNLAAGGNHVRN
jgi:polyisoprenyl-teichoic acid--peptidoglycan teichoic acid transferase